MAPYDNSPQIRPVALPPVALPVVTAPETVDAARDGFLSRRVGLVLTVMLATGAGLALAEPSAALTADPELSRLLRGMAVVKLAFALPIAAAVWWRLGQPASARLAAIYIAIVAGAFAALALVWRLSEPDLASLMFHASLIGFAITALREPALLARLSARRLHSSDDRSRPS